jgi:hypothetical protein
MVSKYRSGQYLLQKCLRKYVPNGVFVMLELWLIGG